MADYKAITYNASTMPPGHKAVVGNLQTFELPESLSGSAADKALGKSMIDAWKRDGILQISMDPINRKLADAAFLCSKKFFGLDYKKKAACLDDQSFAGYIASGEEITDNIADYSEIFTRPAEVALPRP
jgi:isopenicillin N synthase-like dioxygenase